MVQRTVVPGNSFRICLLHIIPCILLLYLSDASRTHRIIRLCKRELYDNMRHNNKNKKEA